MIKFGVLVRNKLGTLAESYDRINLHYSTTLLTEMMEHLSKHSFRIKLKYFGSIKLFASYVIFKGTQKLSRG